MSSSGPPPAERALPGRAQALVFEGKAALLRVRRLARDWTAPVPRHRPGDSLAGGKVVAELHAPLWNHQSSAEFPLTAGKVENLRVAARRLDGLEVPAGSLFSFWRQVGRTTRRDGYREGRELREGCVIPNRGGGLCQLSNLLYGAALDAGFEIVERHAHSRVLPGSLAEVDRDATVFWNYVDLRFRSDRDYRLEVSLDATRLTVRIVGGETGALVPAAPPVSTGAPRRSQPTGDCLTCGMTSCFRHPSATASHRPATGHTAFLLDEFWPEHQEWCARHSQEGDHWLVPLDGDRWNKPNYGWEPPAGVTRSCATVGTLLHALRQRRLPAQGAVRQRALLRRDASLARHYAGQLDPQARHLVVSQNLLPHLWSLGVLGGRSFDVLLTRWPIRELQRRLDEALAAAPDSTTLSDFRADPGVERAEEEALAQAAHVVTPHRALATHFGERALLVDWVQPVPRTRRRNSAPTLFFPASPLGRKGIHPLAEAARSMDLSLRVLGRATEEGPDPLAGVRWLPAGRNDLTRAAAVILPAWIEHRPRILLEALASGIPVIASSACGLGDHPLLYEIAWPDAQAIRAALEQALAEPKPEPCLAP